jgi:hypothetical protein
MAERYMIEYLDVDGVARDCHAEIFDTKEEAERAAKETLDDVCDIHSWVDDYRVIKCD